MNVASARPLANLVALRARAACQEQALLETRERMARVTDDVEAVSADLTRTRAYAFDAGAPLDGVVAGCADALGSYGFTVIDHVIPPAQVAAVREEVVAAQSVIERNLAAIKELQSGNRPAAASTVELRPVRRVGHPPKPPNDIVWMPRYCRHLANPVVTAVARRVLDDHLRIAQLNLRIIEADRADGTPGGFHPLWRMA